MLLAIDTATAACSVALLDEGRLVAEAHAVVGRGHAERLLPMIASLPEGGLASRILVDCGPGSFTGVRVGLAAARALGLAWGAQVAGFSSLALIAAAAPGDADTVAVAIIGGHGELFVQRFARDPLTPLAPPASLVPAQAAALIGEHVVHGSGAEMLVEARGHGVARDALPRAADVVLLPAALATSAPRPAYGRAPDAKPSVARSA